MELVTTLRRADALVVLMRADGNAAAGQAAPVAHQGQPFAAPQSQNRPFASPPAPFQGPTPPPLRSPARPPARSWFAGKSVGVILLILGTLCVLAASAVFVAVAWLILPLFIRAMILLMITIGFGFLAHLALTRRLQATAEAMAVITSGMFILDLHAARSAGLPGIADLAGAPYEILAGTLLACAAAIAAVAVRRRQGWLWSLDVALAVGLTRAAIGALLVSDGLSVASVTVTAVASVLYVVCRRLRLPVAMWTAVGLGAMAWLTALGVGGARAADHVGDDLGRIADSWPALAVALVAGLWSVRLHQAVWRRVAACLSLLPVVMVLEIVGWSHGWVVGAAVMLAGYAIAALASFHVPTAWSQAVGGSAVLLGVSSVFGLLPTVVALAARMWQAADGTWRGTRPLSLDHVIGEVGPWLLPAVALVILALLPTIRIENRRLPFDQRHTAGVVVAALAVLPILYGAAFWVSMATLAMVAIILLVAARLWRRDFVLALGLTLLVVLRICAYYDNLADRAAWSLMTVACLAWAITERRPAVRSGFYSAAGLLALFAVARWLSYADVPVEAHGLLVVALGSLGLLASQKLLLQGWAAVGQDARGSTGSVARGRSLTRGVGEGLSATWAVAGLALAGSSPSHGALELTVIGVAAGITAYISDDRRFMGWVSGVVLTVASWIRLHDLGAEAVEWYTLPASAALLVYGVRRLRRQRSESTWRCLGPGMALALTPSLFVALKEPLTLRGLLASVASVALLALGVRMRLAAPFALGAVSTGLLAFRYVWPVAAYLPRWTLLFIVGGVLLFVGMTWESRVNDVRAAGGYVRGLR